MNLVQSLAFIFAFTLLAVDPSVAGEIPPRPEFGVLDQAGVFPLPVLKATERMLSEHERLTLERISIYTLTGASSRGLPEISSEVFEEWASSAPRPPSSVLILVNGDDGEIEIRAGLGLDPLLPASKISEIRRHFFLPEWAAGKKSRALVLSFVEVLRSLDSPLVSNGTVTDAYERAGFSGGWIPATPRGKSWGAWFFALLGIAAAAFVLVRILIGEVHYTADGWFPVPASTNLRRILRRRGKKTPSLVTGGGVSGSY